LTIREIGDSLAGRFFAYRLHPFDVRELSRQMEPADILARILRVGGFPEPFLENDEIFYARWRRTHLDAVLRQDLLALATISDIQGIETLFELLRTRVGSPISYANLAADLQKDLKTIKFWLLIRKEGRIPRQLCCGLPTIDYGVCDPSYNQLPCRTNDTSELRGSFIGSTTSYDAKQPSTNVYFVWPMREF
jgi:hypothetical protein